MNIKNYYLCALVMSGGLMSSAVAKSRSFPHIGHLMLGVTKLGAAGVCCYAGIQALTHKYQESKDSILGESYTKCATDFEQVVGHGNLKKLLKEDSYNLDSHIIAPLAMLSLSGCSFLAAFKLVFSANRSFSRAYEVADAQDDKAGAEKNSKHKDANDSDDEDSE